MSSVNVSAIGGYIREQREQAKISLRQLAQSAGISNPYLSQIERGLRRPSADILQQIAKGLRISAEALYVQAGFLEDRPPGSVVREAVLTDQELTERQKQMLIEIYESFRKETLVTRAGTTGVTDDQSGLEPDEAGLVWPDDRRPAPVGGQYRLALTATSATSEDEEALRDAWTWSPPDDEAESLYPEDGPEPAGPGQDSAGRGYPENGPDPSAPEPGRTAPDTAADRYPPHDSSR
jgi:transcriptional regulator with XRE-family HTH domain